MDNYMEAMREATMTMLNAHPEFSAVKIPKFASWVEFIRFQCATANNNVGHLNEKDGINCDKCLNRGYFEMFNEETGNTYIKKCSCMAKRESILLMRKSGLDNLLNCSFQNYETTEKWQKSALDMAVDYVNNSDNGWLYFSGQRGGGKTHLCSAICKELMNKGRSVKYMLWTDISQKLDALKYKELDYKLYMDVIKNTDVLYIDDFLKNSLHDFTEIKKAYIIINARDLVEKKTIISSENSIYELDDVDSAISGRIRKQCGNKYIIHITPQDGRDYRKKYRKGFDV